MRRHVFPVEKKMNKGGLTLPRGHESVFEDVLLDCFPVFPERRFAKVQVEGKD